MPRKARIKISGYITSSIEVHNHLMIESSIDIDTLQELKKASALIDAPNIQKKPDINKLEKMLSDYKDIRERNKQILKAYTQSYLQHKIAKVLAYRNLR
jgi:hypothetical protein